MISQQAAALANLGRRMEDEPVYNFPQFKSGVVWPTVSAIVFVLAFGCQPLEPNTKSTEDSPEPKISDADATKDENGGTPPITAVKKPNKPDPTPAPTPVDPAEPDLQVSRLNWDAKTLKGDALFNVIATE